MALGRLSGVDLEPIREDVGVQMVDRAITATLRVSPNGNNVDGSSWTNAYTTIQAALDAASTDADDLTLILLGPSTTDYDINLTGDPTWATNVEIRGSHRNWATVVNTHASATSVMKFTGRVSLYDVTIDCGDGDNNGVIITGTDTKGARLRRVYFECEDVSGAQTALELSGGTEYIRMEDVLFHGDQAQTKGLLLDNCSLSHFKNMDFHDCATGLQIINAASDANIFNDVLLHTCTLGLDIDAGNGQIFDDINFHDCTTNVDDEVGDHQWIEIHGALPITIEPDNLTGVQVNTGVANTYGSDTEIRAAVTSTVPFRVLGAYFDTSTSEWYQVRLSADSGSTFFDVVQLDSDKKRGVGAPSGTGFIFNKGTRISASARDISGSDNVKVWLEIQEI